MSNKLLLSLYEALLKPRMIEEKMLSLLRQGKISKWFSGIGQEAISVGVTMAMDEDEMIFPMHRNLGVFTTRNVPLERLFAQWQGKKMGFTNGRDRSFHFGTKEYNIVGMISHLGPQLSLASGVAMAYKLNKEKKVSFAFTGEGGTSEGEFHEALNTAAVWQLPVIFGIENNGYGLSTPASEQYRCKDLADRAIGYGMDSYIVDGNNVIEVYNTMKKVLQKIRRKPQPILIEFKTFRMRGHEEASGTKYVPKKMMDHWAKLDPLNNFEQYLKKIKLINEAFIEDKRAEIKSAITHGLSIAGQELPADSTVDKELEGVYTPHEHIKSTPSHETQEIRYIDAISEGLDEAMKKHPDLILMGQDIADYGGVFKITDGFLKKYGKDRVKNTPLCESAIIGIGLGLSLKNKKSMIEMQFSDFVTCGFNQIVNNLAKIKYRWDHAADVVIRMPSGGGVGAGPFHSQTTEAWFTHVPGLKIVYPSNPIDAKGLLISAFEDPNPVLYFEHKAMYRKFSAEVPKGYYNTPIGKAVTVSEGNDLSIITYGMGVHWALDAKQQLGIDAEIIDLRSLLPIDYDAIINTVSKTNKVILLHEDTKFGGIGGEISAYISEHLFEQLDAPVMRVASLDTPVPFADNLEKLFLPIERLHSTMQKLHNY